MAVLQQANIRGVLTAQDALTGTIAPVCVLTGALSIPVGYKDYTGSYEVTPRVDAQTLPTTDRHMVDDVTVQAIPYYEVSNLQKGKTVIIGG